ncbi:MAG: hypothetical protein ACK4UJ_02890 [Leptonema sp. (in: bacteria)]
MFLKSLEELQKQIQNYPKNKDLIVVIYGKDVAILNYLLELIEKKIFKNTPYELITLTGESEDLSQIVNELYNYSLFLPNRIYVIRQGNIIFKNYNFVITELPPKTWLMIEYEGLFPFKIIKSPEDKVFYYETKILYENQIDSFLQNLAKKLNFVFSEEALTEIKMLFPPKESILRTALLNLDQNIKRNKEEIYSLTYEEIRNVFFPSEGWDIFRIVDSCFKKDLQTFLIEIEKYNPPEDNYYSLLKNLLNRTDELRKFVYAKKLNLNTQEILKLINAEKKPNRIQKKIIRDLEYAYNLFSLEKISKIYNFLIEISFAFRQNIEDSHKKTVFTKKAIEVFFS